MITLYNRTEQYEKEYETALTYAKRFLEKENERSA